MIWVQWAVAVFILAVATGVVVWRLRPLKEVNAFLAEVHENVGPAIARELRGRRTPTYLIFERVPVLQFRSERNEMTLRRFPRLSEYRGIRSREVLRQYRQELTARARMIEAVTVVGTAAYGVIASMLIPPLVKVGWGHFVVSHDDGPLSQAWLSSLGAVSVLLLILFVFVLLPLLGIARAHRALRRGEIHVKRINEVLSARQEAAQRQSRRGPLSELIRAICMRISR